MASETKVTKHYLEIGSVKYFRGKSENVQICSFGQKKKNLLGAKAYLAVEANVKRQHLVGKIKSVPPVKINWTKMSQADVEVNGQVRYFVLNAKKALSASYEQIKKGNLELMKFYINEGSLKKMLNEDAHGARKYLDSEGMDGRIVSEIWVAMKAELAEHFKTSGSNITSASLSVAKGEAELAITASGGTQQSQTIVLSPGTTFAYLMHKVKKWDKDKIKDMEDDQKGLN